MAPIPLPVPVVQCIGGATTRSLNTGSLVADKVRFSSVANGGHENASFRILESEYNAFAASAYAYGATVRIRSNTTGGTVLWEGYLQAAVPSPDDTVTLTAQGWFVLLEEREESLLWQIVGGTEWQDYEDDPFNGNNSDGYNIGVRNGALSWRVSRGENLQGLADPDNTPCDRARIALWVDPNINFQRIAGTVKQNIDNPGANNATFNMRFERWDGPTAGNRQIVRVMDDLLALAASNNNFNFNQANYWTVPKPMVSFLFWRTLNTPSGGQQNAFGVVLEKLRVNGDAYRPAAVPPADWDVYAPDEVVKDLANRFGWTTLTTAPNTPTNILPLFWDEGSWSELMEYLANASKTSGTVGYRWAVWEGPQLEFRGWASGTTWQVRAYGNQAMSIADIRPSDDRYTHIAVKYRLVHQERWREYKLATGVSFTGNRRRTLRFKIKDRLRLEGADVPTLVTQVANNLASEYGTEYHTGSINLSYATRKSSGVDTSSYQIRAGDLVEILDFPTTGGGTTTLTVRVYEADHDDTGTTLGIGRKPQVLERLLIQRERKHNRSGLVPS